MEDSEALVAVVDSSRHGWRTTDQSGRGVTGELGVAHAAITPVSKVGVAALEAADYRLGLEVFVFQLKPVQ
jgi:hypothetical protein